MALPGAPRCRKARGCVVRRPTRRWFGLAALAAQLGVRQQMPPPLRSAGASISLGRLLVAAAASVSEGATRRTWLPVCEAVQFHDQWEAAGGGNLNHPKIQHVVEPMDYRADPRKRSGEAKKILKPWVRSAPARYARVCAAALRQDATQQVPWRARGSASAQVPTPLVSWQQSWRTEQKSRLVAGLIQRPLVTRCTKSTGFQLLPNPSLKRSANGRPPGPGRWYAVHFHRPGPGVLPSPPA